METFKDEIKNLKAITRVIAALVLANFVIIAVVVGPDSVGFDPTYGPITAILNFVIAFLTTGVLMGIYVVFDVKQTFDLSHMHNVLFVSVTVQMLFALGSVFNYYSVFDTVLDPDTVGAISGSFTNTVFFFYGMYVYLLVRTDKRRGNQLSNRTQTVGIIFAVIIIPAQALTLFGIIPAAGGTQTIPRQIGLGHSLDLLLLGKQIEVDKSLEIGLIDYCIEENRIVEFAHSLLDSLCRNPRELNQLTKSIISQGLELSLAQGLDLEAKRCIEYIIETGQG